MKNFLTISVLLVAPLVFLWGCDNDTTNVVDGPPTTDKTCLGCHSDQAELEATADKEEGSKYVRYNKGDG